MKRFGLFACAVFWIAGCASSDDATQSASAAAAPADDTPVFLQPIDLIPEATGAHKWPISTDDPLAQAYFDQGMQLRWAYNVNEAARSMAEARRIDPECAICYWGEAFALGSFLNQGMSAEKAQYAHAAIERAVELADGASPLERDLIMATRVRYPADYDPANRRVSDEAFAAEMARVYETYPDNHEVATVYAVALFLLEDRRGHRDIEDPDVVRLHGVLTGVLDEDITHPGACHLYVHATESTTEPGRALACAEHLSDAIPIASHIQHMPSHTWNEVGYWGRSVRANQQAVRSDMMAADNGGFSYGPTHNLHMMLFAASMDGQSAAALQAGRDFTRVSGGNFTHELLTLLRFGRFEEILEVGPRPDADIPGGYWEFAQGYARLRTGDVEAAQTHLARLQDLAANSTDSMGVHSAAHLMGLSAALLEGEILRTQGDLEGAIAAFRRAAEIDDQQEYSEPEPIPYAARHWLGAALMEAGRYAEAESEYRLELTDHPHNVWSLTGLVAALEAQGKSDAAVESDFAESTARVDLWVPASRF
ncbi:MAG: hypothetical protein PVI23_03130 [Maricaulaceae bacterium]|jgi:Flp pilus assembly protein TadD